MLDLKVEAGQVEIAHPVIPELVKDLPICLSDQGAEFEPCRPEERHLVQRPNEGILGFQLLVPLLVDEAEKVAIQTVQVTLRVVLFQLLLYLA